MIKIRLGSYIIAAPLGWQWRARVQIAIHVQGIQEAAWQGMVSVSDLENAIKARNVAWVDRLIIGGM